MKRYGIYLLLYEALDKIDKLMARLAVLERRRMEAEQ